ncbi:MAG: GAF domain-containing protein [Pseudomonadales bacterium]|nr:GAF domain-containing protein [Pseudomonadales bacterium]
MQTIDPDLRLDDIRACMDGVIPGVIATCAADGVPNVSFFSQLEYVDPGHVALSFQFFNKTRENILGNPFASVNVPDPLSGATYRLVLEYLRTETEGPLFERMKARLAGIAAHEGMSDVFRLRGSDVYRVLEIERVPGEPVALAGAPRHLLGATRACIEHIAGCGAVDELMDVTLADVDRLLGMERAMILLLDGDGDRLYTVASRGYPSSGVGSEVPVGAGLIGVAVRERCPIRISFTAPEYGYSRAVREATMRGALAARLETAIPFPGLEDPQSQLAVPIVAAQRTLGALYVDSDLQMRFTCDDEDALAVVASRFGAALLMLTDAAGVHGDGSTPVRRQPPPGPERRCVVRHYDENDSVFFDDAYLIKGVAGAILWRLLEDHVRNGRSEFSNRELRLDPRLRFPELNDNLEARLILLQRRLAERSAPVQIVKTGRGRFAIHVGAQLVLEAVAAGARR